MASWLRLLARKQHSGLCWPSTNTTYKHFYVYLHHGDEDSHMGRGWGSAEPLCYHDRLATLARVTCGHSPLQGGFWTCGMCSRERQSLADDSGRVRYCYCMLSVVVVGGNGPETAPLASLASCLLRRLASSWRQAGKKWREQTRGGVGTSQSQEEAGGRAPVRGDDW